jgi:hypothetical protein
LRTEEYGLFETAKIKEWIKEFGLDVIGMRDLKTKH